MNMFIGSVVLLLNLKISLFHKLSLRNSKLVILSIGDVSIKFFSWYWSECWRVADFLLPFPASCKWGGGNTYGLSGEGGNSWGLNGFRTRSVENIPDPEPAKWSGSATLVLPSVILRSFKCFKWSIQDGLSSRFKSIILCGIFNVLSYQDIKLNVYYNILYLHYYVV